MKKTYLQRGFTLIELLVVIAIIGILSSVVLASLTSARGKAQAVATRSSLKSLQPAIAVCNGDVTTLLTTPGGPVCAGNTALLPTATQLGATSVTYAIPVASSTLGAQGLTATLGGHPVAACTLFHVMESELLSPALCK